MSRPCSTRFLDWLMRSVTPAKPVNPGPDVVSGREAAGLLTVPSMPQRARRTTMTVRPVVGGRAGRVRGALLSTVASAALLTAGCNDDAFCYGESTESCGLTTHHAGTAGTSTGGSAGNAGNAGGVPGGASGIGGSATCEADTSTDLDNCGTCGHRCDLLNAFAKCEGGECKIDSCVPGFVDLDPNVDGCEYTCPVFPITAELCDGLDNDCDGKVDADDADLEPPPSLNCKNTAGTLCEGVVATCLGETGWACNYPAGVEVEMGMIRAEETLCDGIDGDCDGTADDWFVLNYGLGSACTSAATNGCIDHGLIACNTAATSPDDPKVLCDLSLVPDSLTPMPETCNGLDDDCNGTVDDMIDPATYAMVEIAGHPGVFVDKYEASRPDATVTAPGLLENLACTNAGVLPWASGSYTEAATACAARGTGFRLCTADELAAACSNGTTTAYPYGDSYAPATCNGVDRAADPDVVATGSLNDCTTTDGVLDLSGNLAEWTSTQTNLDPAPGRIFQLHGGSYLSPGTGLTCTMELAPRALEVTLLPNVGFRCCRQ